MGKTVDDLIASREYRAQVKAKFGGEVPTSILVRDSFDKVDDASVDARCYNDTEWKDDTSQFKITSGFALSGKGTANGALSRFPQSVGRKLLRLYTEEGQTVFDPFAGHNSRMELCWRDRRNYIGCDCCEKFMDANRAKRDRLLLEKEDDLFGTDHFTASIELHLCDSRDPPVPNNCADFTITSPPYWDQEFYGNENAQLGKIPDYDEFIRQLGVVALENQKRLRSGSFCVWCVNDFRQDKKFFAFHADTIRIMREAGLKLFDIVIIDLGHPIRAAFASQVIEHKILPKRHEYALVFRKQ